VLAMDFKLKSEYIELDNLLKAQGLVVAEAREIILAGSIKVNGEKETRIRRKLRSGDTVEFKGQRVSIAA
jgi:ribosome-associated protein